MANDLEYKPIKNWSDDDKPREKLEKYGAENLSDSELLAILIGSGSKGFSAVDAARKLLEIGRNLSSLSKFSTTQIKSVKGLGTARAVTLQAAFEIAKRIKSSPVDNSLSITSPSVIANLFIPRFYGEMQEMFYVILLNSKKQIISEKMISKGTLDSTIIHSRDVFKYAIDHSASSIVLLHNHPSGNPIASGADIQTTEELVQAGKILDIPIVDHLIIAGDRFTSLRSEGLVSFSS